VRGRQLGVRPEAIEIVRAQGGLEGLNPREALFVEMARSLVRDKDLPDALFTRGLEELGADQLVEFVTLVGQYGLIGLVLKTFQVPPPDDNPTF
jgi:hypothetical protein